MALFYMVRALPKSYAEPNTSKIINQLSHTEQDFFFFRASSLPVVSTPPPAGSYRSLFPIPPSLRPHRRIPSTPVPVLGVQSREEELSWS